MVHNGRIRVFWVVGVEVDNYDLEMAILSHGGWGTEQYLSPNNTYKVTIYHLDSPS